MLNAKKNSPEGGVGLCSRSVSLLGRNRFPMALKQKSATAVASPPSRAGSDYPGFRGPERGDADAAFLCMCEAVAQWPREDLLAVAVARGCRHYATLWPDVVPHERPGLPHEILRFSAARCCAGRLIWARSKPSAAARWCWAIWKICRHASRWRRKIRGRRACGAHRRARPYGRPSRRILAGVARRLARRGFSGARLFAGRFAAGLRNPPHRSWTRAGAHVAADRLPPVNPAQTIARTIDRHLQPPTEMAHRHAATS